MYKKLVKMYFRFLKKHYLVQFLSFMAITIVLTIINTNIEIRSSFIELLSKKSESRSDLEYVIQKFGGEGFITLAIEKKNKLAKSSNMIKFADAIARELSKPKYREYVKFVDYKVNTSFFKNRELLYLNIGDLKKIRKRIKDKIRFEKRKKNPLYIMLDEKLEEVKLDFSDIRSKYKIGSSKTESKDENNTKDDDKEEKIKYYFNSQKNILAMLIKPGKPSSDLGYSRRLVETIKNAVKKIGAKNYDPNIKWGLSGRYVSLVEQDRVLNRDLYGSATMAIIAIVVIIWLYFRRVRAIFVVILPLITGIIWSISITYFIYGYFNIITGFLIAILIGLGIDFGIHIFSRYLEERKAGKGLFDALETTFLTTMVSIRSCATTTAAGFLSLILTQFKGFHQFGLIAGLGMIAMLFSLWIIFPSVLVISEKIREIRPENIKVFTLYGIEKSRGKKFKSYWLVIILAIAFTLYSAFNVGRVRFDYDFSKLKDVEQPAEKLDKKLSGVFKISLWPSILYIEKKSELYRFKKFVDRRINRIWEIYDEIEEDIDDIDWNLTLKEKLFLARNYRDLNKLIKDMLFYYKKIIDAFENIRQIAYKSNDEFVKKEFDDIIKEHYDRLKKDIILKLAKKRFKNTESEMQYVWSIIKDTDFATIYYEMLHLRNIAFKTPNPKIVRAQANNIKRLVSKLSFMFPLKMLKRYWKSGIHVRYNQRYFAGAARVLKKAKNASRISNNFIADIRELVKESLNCLPTIEKIDSIFSLVPEDQDRKLREIAKIKKILRKHKKTLDELTGEDKDNYERLKELLEVKKISMNDVPKELIRRLVADPDHPNKDFFVFVYPKLYISMSNAKDLNLYTRDLRLITKSDEIKKACKIKKPIPIASEAMIFREILTYIENDKDKILFLVIFAILLIIYIDFRSLIAVFATLFPLTLGILWMLGAMVMFNIPFNYFNIIVIPILLGMGIDSGIHIYHRYIEEGRQNILYIMRSTGMAIFLSSITTMIGFGSLINSSFGGLHSIGLLAIVGLSSTLLTALFVMPAFLQLTVNIRQKKKAGG